MNDNHISNLLEKYWDGESTLQEENKLRDYFSGDVADEHKKFIPMFRMFSAAKVESMDAPLKLEKKDNIRSLFNRRVIGIAASLIFLASVVTFNLYEPASLVDVNYHGQKVEITEEEEALEMTMEALAFLGAKWEKSSQTINKNVRKMEKVSILK